MIKLIEPQEKYMNGYEEAYLLSLAEVNKGNITMHDLMFDNPHEIDVIKKMINSSDQKKLPPHYVPSYLIDFLEPLTDTLRGTFKNEELIYEFDKSKEYFPKQFEKASCLSEKRKSLMKKIGSV